jgi:large subunit ribosomal protein L21
MYAIVDIAGQQFKIEKDNKLLINRIKGEVGEKVNFSKVLFIANEGKVKIGSPYIKDASVTVKILSHLKGDKIKVFKKKKRKGYTVLNGYRHYLTEVVVENISETKIDAKVTSSKESPKAAEKATPKLVADKKVTLKKGEFGKAASSEKKGTSTGKPAAKTVGPKTGSKKPGTSKSSAPTAKKRGNKSK